MTYPKCRMRLRALTRQCIRCRKVYIVNAITEQFHQTCKVTMWGPEWKK